MFKLKSPSQQEQILALAMRQIEKLLKEMQNEGKDLSRLKLKKFQKTHHIDCNCKLCEVAKTKNDPRLRGLSEDGFKVYVNGDKKISQRYKLIPQLRKHIMKSAVLCLLRVKNFGVGFVLKKVRLV